MTCATRLAILGGSGPIGTNVFSVGSRVTSREIALKEMVIGIVILSWMYQAPPLLKPLAVPLLPLLLLLLLLLCLVQMMLSAYADSLNGVSVTSAVGVSATGPALDTQLDVDLDSVTSDYDHTPTVGPTPSAPSIFDSRDNQLDELVSQPLLSSPVPSGADVDSACFDSPASPPSPDQGPRSSAFNVELLGKLKLKVDLNKKKDLKVNVSNASDGSSTNASNVRSNSNDNDNDLIKKLNAKRFLKYI